MVLIIFGGYTIMAKPLPAYAFTMIIKQQYLGHKTLCITMSLDTSIVDIILLGNCSQMKLSLLTLWSQKIT